MTKTRSEEPRSNPSQSFSTRLRNSHACENMHDRSVVMGNGWELVGWEIFSHARHDLHGHHLIYFL